MHYIETFIVNGRTYGIEDLSLSNPSAHNDTSRRYTIWAGGGAIGHVNELSEARGLLYNYIKIHLDIERKGHTERSDKIGLELIKLGEDSFNLGKFMQ